MSKTISPKFCVFAFSLAVLATPCLAVAATGPIAGVYSVSTYVVSATATNGGTCGAPAGDYLSSYFYYPGPAKQGAVQRHSINGPRGNFIQLTDFPLTPDAGVSSWAGDYSSEFFPSGITGGGTFSTTFTFIDADSFLGTTTYIYPVGQNSVCTTVFQNTYIRTGKSLHHKGE